MRRYLLQWFPPVSLCPFISRRFVLQFLRKRDISFTLCQKCNSCYSLPFCTSPFCRWIMTTHTDYLFCQGYAGTKIYIIFVFGYSKSYKVNVDVLQLVLLKVYFVLSSSPTRLSLCFKRVLWKYILVLSLASHEKKHDDACSCGM